MHKYNCEICGAEIHSTGKKRILKCESCLKRERSKREREETSSPYRKYTNNAELRKEVCRLEEYNRIHGTDYSYGKYINLKFLGKI